MNLKSVPGIEVPSDEGDVPLPNGCTLYWKMDKATSAINILEDDPL